jgi:acetylornithine deacetylase/succinyl-diaminopimelate desuccinylase-like protein
MSLRRWLASGALSLVSSGLLAAPVAPLKYRTMASDTLRELVEIDSVEPHGSRECVEAIAKRLRAAGFTDQELTILAPEEHPEKANLVVHLRGKGAGKPLLWTGHLDVVEADPKAENAIYRLSAGLLRLSNYRFPLRLTATTRRFLSVAAGLEAEPVRSDIHSVLATPRDAAAVERLSAHPNLNARIRTTCVATQLSAGAAENALPQRAQATVQCRLLPGDRPEAVQHSLQEVIADPQVDIALTRPVIESPETVPDPHVIETITRVVDSFWPHLPVLVTMEAGGSDAIFTRAAGIPTYGVGSIFGDIDNNRHHGRDERISKNSFDEGVEFTYRLVKQVDRELTGDR